MKTQRLLLVLTLCIAGCSKKENDLKSPVVPVAGFIYTNPSIVNAAITFKNTSANAVTYNWDFGDGMTSQEVNPVHTYTKEGTYNVVLLSFPDSGINVSNDAIVKSIKIDPPTR